MNDKEMLICEECESEVIDGLGCDCGNYPPEQNRVDYFVENQTGYKVVRS